MISMLYGSRIRVGELVRLRIRDIDFSSLSALVRRRDAREYVFLTMNGRPCGRRTVQAIFTRAFQASGIQKNASCHTLRHSFATSLLGNGRTGSPAAPARPLLLRRGCPGWQYAR